jgi:peptidyl-prolyl cis-trans isomerase B (cyclophilin B)
VKRPLALALLMLLIATALAACGSEDEGAGTTADIPAEEAQTAPATTPTTPSASPGTGCEQVEKPKAKPDGGAKKPKEPLDDSKTWTLEVKTNCGDFTIELDLKAAPKASASMVALAQAGFFKNTIFHRIVPGFVIQGGDPTGTGQGGPGYSTVDPPPPDATYTKGVVAMAKTQTEAPGTAGSQFYVVTGADAGLPPEYAVIGKVTDGLDTVEKIGELGGPDELPTQVVVITDVVAKGS